MYKIDNLGCNKNSDLQIWIITYLQGIHQMQSRYILVVHADEFCEVSVQYTI